MDNSGRGFMQDFKLGQRRALMQAEPSILTKKARELAEFLHRYRDGAVLGVSALCLATTVIIDAKKEMDQTNKASPPPAVVAKIDQPDAKTEDLVTVPKKRSIMMGCTSSIRLN